MADTLRIVSLPDDGRRPTSLLDLNDTAGLTCVLGRDTFKVTPPPPKQQVSAHDERYGGGLVVGESHDNGGIGGTFRVKGATAALAITQLQALLVQVSTLGPARYVEWRPDGNLFSTYFELRGPAAWDGQYRWVQFAQTRGVEVDVTMPVAPLSCGALMDIWDDFAADDFAAGLWSYGTGSGFTVSGGLLVPGNTSEAEVFRADRGYQYGDGEGTLDWTAGAAVTGSRGITLSRIDASNYLLVHDNAGTLTISKKDAGSLSSLGSPVAMPGFVAGAYRAVRGRLEGNVVIAEAFTSPPTPMATPAATYSFTLTGADATKYGAASTGAVGFRTTGVAVDYRYRDYHHRPFTWRGQPIPAVIRPAGSIPGDAAALLTSEITTSGVSRPPSFAMLSWADTVDLNNYVWNGDFEVDTHGWQVALVTGVQAVAGTSIARVTTAARVKYGTAAGEIVTPASSGSGANFPVYRKFRRGVVYTAETWMSSAAGVTSMVLKLGVSGDVATSGGLALTTTPTRISVTWTPTADVDVAWVSIQTNAATATTFDIDGAMVYEGTTAPTSVTQAEGRGAPPPFGLIEAESADTLGSGLAVTAGAGTHAGFTVNVTAAGAGSTFFEWFIDPSLLDPDPWLLGEVDVEVYLRAFMNLAWTGTTLTLSAYPAAGTAFGQQRYTQEFGQSGRPVSQTVSAMMRYRLGTLRLPVDAFNPTRWKLRLDVAWSAGTSNSNFDFIIMAPARRSSTSPTGELTADGNYPTFIRSTAETTKVVRPDLSGYNVKDGGRIADQGLGGALPLVDPGTFDFIADASAIVPDDPAFTDVYSDLLGFGSVMTVHLGVQPRYYLARGS